MFERCLSTLDSTETQVACWIHSINDSYYHKEFKCCQRKSSEEKYWGPGDSFSLAFFVSTTLANLIKSRFMVGCIPKRWPND